LIALICAMREAHRAQCIALYHGGAIESIENRAL
jgi:hypothetical protein